MNSLKWAIAQTLLRSVLKAGAGGLVAKGWMENDEATQVVGAVMLIAGVVWGILHRTPKAPRDFDPNAIPLLILIPLLFIAQGCAWATHKRPVLLMTPNGNPVVSYESESARSFLMKGAIDKLRVSTKDGQYSHSLTAAAISGQGDPDTIRALVEAGATAAATGAKIAAGAP